MHFYHLSIHSSHINVSIDKITRPLSLLDSLSDARRCATETTVAKATTADRRTMSAEREGHNSGRRKSTQLVVWSRICCCRRRRRRSHRRLLAVCSERERALNNCVDASASSTKSTFSTLSANMRAARRRRAQLESYVSRSCRCRPRLQRASARSSGGGSRKELALLKAVLRPPQLAVTTRCEYRLLHK